MSGRSRGRARGRARGGAADAEASRRPGEVEKTAPQAASSAPAASAAPSHGGGRACHRGGANAEQRPGDQLDTAMAGMSLQTPGGRQRPSMKDREQFYIEPHTRPVDMKNKQGTSGTSLKLISNYFRLQSSPTWHLYQYAVSFQPEVLSMSLRSWLVKSLRDTLGSVRAFDGAILYLPHRLPSDPAVFTAKKRDDTTIQVTFKLTNELAPNSPTCITMFNVIFRRILNILEMKQIGRHYFNPKDGVTVPKHKLEIWPGFITSILQYESNILLCTEVAHKIMRMDTALDVMYNYYEAHSRRGNFHDEAKKYFIGQIVLTRYNNKTYPIDDVDFTKNPNSTFTMKDGTEKSFVAYYKEQYEMTIIDMEQPLLVSKPKKRDQRAGITENILLVPELCTITGLSDELKKDFQVMKDVAVHTRVEPQERNRVCQNFIDKITKNPEVQKELDGWGLKFDNQLIRINGRILPPEKILAATTGFHYKPREADWSREMRGQKLISCPQLRDWLLVFTRRDSPKAGDFLQNLCRVAPPMGIQISEPHQIELPDDSTTSFLKAIKQETNKNTQMVVAVLPSDRKDRYDAIKKLLCVDTPIPSQIVLGRTLSKQKMLMSVATKIAVQLNCKLGGEVWAVEMPLKNLMVVGIDCYHDSATKGLSVGAFVASTNKYLTSYFSKVTFQHEHGELINGLKVCMMAALKKYHEKNGALPERIIIYRDGVGDGMLRQVVETELPQLLSCFKTIGEDYDPKLTVVVVKKRINSRFFAVGQTLQNPPPGTVVDSEVTRPEWYDFFLVSQAVRQGTVTPSHYNVIWDTIGLGPDKMQRLTYKLTHLYYNWPGTIRVPAPCQYAHKLAFLVGQSLHAEPNPALSDKLFYL